MAIIEQNMIAAVVEAAVEDQIKLYPLAKVVPMEAKAGGTIVVPQKMAVTAAVEVDAGGDITCEAFSMGQVTHQVAKAAKGIQFTVEDLNNSYVDVQKEAEEVLGKAIAQKLEADLVAALGGATNTKTIAEMNSENLPDALIPFGDNLDDDMFLIVSPTELAAIRKDPQFVMNANYSNDVNSVGMLYGMEVVVSNKVTAGTAFIIKKEALALYVKKDVLVEQEKDIHTQTHHIIATQHYVAVLNDDSKAIKLTIGADDDAGAGA